MKALQKNQVFNLSPSTIKTHPNCTGFVCSDCSNCRSFASKLLRCQSISNEIFHLVRGSTLFHHRNYDSPFWLCSIRSTAAITFIRYLPFIISSLSSFLNPLPSYLPYKVSLTYDIVFFFSPYSNRSNVPTISIFNCVSFMFLSPPYVISSFELFGIFPFIRSAFSLPFVFEVIYWAWYYVQLLYSKRILNKHLMMKGLALCRCAFVPYTCLE